MPGASHAESLVLRIVRYRLDHVVCPLQVLGVVVCSTHHNRGHDRGHVLGKALLDEGCFWSALAWCAGLQVLNAAYLIVPILFCRLVSVG